MPYTQNLLSCLYFIIVGLFNYFRWVFFCEVWLKDHLAIWQTVLCLTEKGKKLDLSELKSWLHLCFFASLRNFFLLPVCISLGIYNLCSSSSLGELMRQLLCAVIVKIPIIFRICEQKSGLLHLKSKDFRAFCFHYFSHWLKMFTCKQYWRLLLFFFEGYF